jgi:hypothetical protein
MFRDNFIALFTEIINSLIRMGFEDLTAVVMNIVIFWDVTQCSPHVKLRFGGKYHLHLQGRKLADQETTV